MSTPKNSFSKKYMRLFEWSFVPGSPIMSPLMEVLDRIEVGVMTDLDQRVMRIRNGRPDPLRDDGLWAGGAPWASPWNVYLNEWRERWTNAS